MRNAQTLKAQRRATTRSLHYIALGGIALLLLAASTALWFSTQTDVQNAENISTKT